MCPRLGGSLPRSVSSTSSSFQFSGFVVWTPVLRRILWCSVSSLTCLLGVSFSPVPAHLSPRPSHPTRAGPRFSVSSFAVSGAGAPLLGCGTGGPTDRQRETQWKKRPLRARRRSGIPSKLGAARRRGRFTAVMRAARSGGVAGRGRVRGRGGRPSTPKYQLPPTLPFGVGLHLRVLRRLRASVRGHLRD